MVDKEELQDDHYCRARTKKGKACRAAAMEGGLCYFHANPNKAAELGRIGGRENRRRSPDLDPLLALDSAAKISTSLDRVISELYTGQLSPRVADTLGRLLNVRLRAVQVAELERSLKEIEKRVETGPSQDPPPISKLQERLDNFEEEVAKAPPRDNDGDGRSID